MRKETFISWRYIIIVSLLSAIFIVITVSCGKSSDSGSSEQIILGVFDLADPPDTGTITLNSSSPVLTFSWTSSTNADNYKLEIFNNSAMVLPAIYSKTGITTTDYALVLTDNLKYASTYYWRVTAIAVDVTKVVDITFSYTIANSAPSFGAISNQIIAEGQPLTITANAVDFNGDTISYSTSVLPFGANFSGNTLTWTPDYTVSTFASPNSVFTITFTATANSLTAATAATITVINVDRPPVLTSPGNKTVNENIQLTFTLSASDIDGDPITYSMVGTPTGATFNSQTGVFSWTPDYAVASFGLPNNDFPVTFTAAANNLSETVSITITVHNTDRLSVFSPVSNQIVAENQTITITVSASDPDGDSILYSATGLPAGSNFSGTVFTWTPDYSIANYQMPVANFVVTFIAMSNGLTSTSAATVSVTNIDRPPVLNIIADKIVDEGQVLTFSVVAIDPDSDLISYSYTSSSDLTGASLDFSSGLFSWTPDYLISNFEFPVSDFVVTFTATSNFLSDSRTMVITVNNVDRPPVLNAVADKTVNEGQVLSFSLAASDPDGDIIAYAMTPTSIYLLGATLDSSTGAFSWVPDYSVATFGFPVSDFVVTFTATSYSLSDSAAITVAVNNVDRPPVLTPPGNKTVNENAQLTFTLSASDIDGDPITYSMVGTPTGAALNSATGVFEWTPGFDQAGPHLVTFTATSNLLSDSKSIIIGVINIDRPPVLESPGDQVIYENFPLVFTLLAADPDGNTITYSMNPVLPGAVLDSATGVFYWTPGYNICTSKIPTSTFYVTSTATANMLSDSKAIAITVYNTDRPPIIVSPLPNKSVLENEILTFNILAGDLDLDAVTLSMVSTPTVVSATLTFVSSTPDITQYAFEWMPDFEQAGSYIFTFIAASNLLTDSRTATITVNNVDRSPVLEEIGPRSVSEGELLSFAISASDPDGDTIIYSTSELPAGAEFDPDTRTFNWTPTAGQSGSYDITFTVTSNSLTDFEVVTITVN